MAGATLLIISVVCFGEATGAAATGATATGATVVSAQIFSCTTTSYGLANATAALWSAIIFLGFMIGTL